MPANSKSKSDFVRKHQSPNSGGTSKPADMVPKIKAGPKPPKIPTDC